MRLGAISFFTALLLSCPQVDAAVLGGTKPFKVSAAAAAGTRNSRRVMPVRNSFESDLNGDKRHFKWGPSNRKRSRKQPKQQPRPVSFTVPKEFRDPLAQAMHLSREHTKTLSTGGSSFWDQYDLAWYDEMGRFSNEGYSYAIDERNDDSSMLQLGYPGFRRFAKPSVPLADVHKKQKELNRAMYSDEACGILDELLALDGIRKTSLSLENIKNPSKAFFALALAKKQGGEGLKVSPFEPVYFRFNAPGGVITSKIGYRNVRTHTPPEAFRSTDDAIRYLKSEADGGAFCGFYSVPEGIQAKIRMNWSVNARKWQLLRTMSHVTDLMELLFQQINYLEHVGGKVKEQLQSYKQTLSSFFGSFSLLYSEIEEIPADNQSQKDLVLLERVVANYHTTLSGLIEKLHVASKNDHFEKNEDWKLFLEEAKRSNATLVALKAILRDRTPLPATRTFSLFGLDIRL